VADYNEQINILWDEWMSETGQESGDPADFIDWGVSKRRLSLGPQDMKQLLRKKVTQALRQAKRYDIDGGFHYRAKQSLTLFDKEGVPVKHYFDTDLGGSPRLRQRATRQRREAVAHDVYRAVCDVEFAEIIATGRFSLAPNSLEGKWFAESFEAAREWGDAFFRMSGVSHDKIVVTELAEDAADRLFRIPLLDGIGPARFAAIDELNSLLSVREATP